MLFVARAETVIAVAEFAEMYASIVACSTSTSHEGVAVYVVACVKVQAVAVPVPAMTRHAKLPPVGVPGVVPQAETVGGVPPSRRRP